MSANALTVAKRVQTVIAELVSAVATENSYGETLVVQLRKRVHGNGRLKDKLMVFQKGITIAPLGPQQAGGTNEREDWAYRFVIAIAIGTMTDKLDLDDWPFAAWEQAIRQRFQQRRLGGMSLTNACELHTVLRPGDLPEWAELAEGLEATFLTLTCFVREARR